MGAYKKLPGEERQMVGAFSVECPACGAPPGFACRKPKGRTQYDTHKARRERAYAQALAQAFDVSYRLEHPGPTHIMPRSGAFISVHLHAPPQHVDPAHAACGPAEANLAPLGSDLCTILHPNFGEYPFHALG